MKYTIFKSNLDSVLYGVPQGSILSPVIFLLYNNDISKYFDYVKCVLYAEDTNLFVESETINSLYMLGNQVVTAYNEWFLVKRLTLTKNKTLHVIFHKKQKKLPPNSRTLKLDDVIINKVENAVFFSILSRYI